MWCVYFVALEGSCTDRQQYGLDCEFNSAVIKYCSIEITINARKKNQNEING